MKSTRQEDKRLVISTASPADGHQGMPGWSQEGSDWPPASASPARPQPEALRYRHQVQARQTRARRVIHRKRIK